MLLLLQFLTILSNYISAYVKSKSNIIKFKITAALFNACAIICSGGHNRIYSCILYNHKKHNMSIQRQV